MSFYEDASWLLIPSGIEEDIVFAQKPISGLGDLQFTRASDATYTDSTGVVRRSPYNLLQQSEDFSNVAWVKPNLTIGIDSTVAPNGTLTADKIIPSTLLSFHPLGQVRTVISGTIYSFSIYAKAGEYNFLLINTVSGSSSGNVGPLFNLSNGTLIGSLGGNTYNAQIVSVGNGWYRISFSFTTNATSATIDINTFPTSTIATYSGNGTDGVFLWGAQLVEGTEALDYFPTTNRQDVPRIDFRNADGTLSSCGRLLLEPQRTNSIRNSSMVGAVVGTPGTGPTNWSLGVAGLTRSISGVGIENGLPYVDIRFQGVASGTSLISYFDNTTAIAASTGQTWSLSTYCKFTSNPNPPVSTSLWQVEWTSGGISVVAVNTQTITPSANLQRFSYTRTLAGGATTASIQPGIQFALVVGQSYDFTIRIAAPQMELGGYATTWVPTTTAAVTRIADAASRSIPSIISATGGTFIVDTMPTISTGTNQTIGTVNDGSTSRGFWLGMDAGTLILRYRNGAGVNGISGPTITNGQRIKAAVKWDGTNFTLFANGVKYGTITSGHPSTINSVSLNGEGVFFGISQHRVNQSFIFPTALSDAQCIELTTL